MSLQRTWTKTSSTTWERIIDDVESFYLFVGASGQGRPDSQNWYTCAGIKVDTERDDFAAEVRSAWTALRYEHPILAAVIENDRWIYRSADEHELSSWLTETLHIHTGPQTARQLFPYSTNPGRRATLHVFPNTQELVIASPHTHVDAFGMATFFDDLLRFLAAPAPTSPPAFGDEAKNLLPPLSILAKVQRDLPSEQRERFDALLQNFISSFPTVRVHNENPGAPARNTKLAWLALSHDETAALVAKTKALGLSVTGVAQAAISRAAKIHGQVTNDSHATFGLYNGREYIDAADAPQSQLVGPHVFALPLVFPVAHEPFTATARAARNVFLDAKAGGLNKDASPVWSVVMPQVLSAAPPPDMPVAADLLLSSVGVVDSYLGDKFPGAQGRSGIEVRDFWIALDMLGPSVGVEMWTRRGEMTFMFIYNEAYHMGDSVADLAGLVCEQLAQGLGVNLRAEVKVPGDERYAVGKGEVLRSGEEKGVVEVKAVEIANVEMS